MMGETKAEPAPVPSNIAASQEPLQNDEALRLEEYGVAFGDHVVLASVEFSLAPKSMNVLLGPAGSGKSTLLRTLVGANNAQPSLKTWGVVYVDGMPLAKETTDSATARKLALVMQDSRFLTSKVRENLVACLVNRSQMQPFEQTQKITQLLKHWGLGEVADKLQQDVIEFPLGTQRRLAIIRAMASNPSALLVDEATANLEENEAADLLLLLKKCAKETAVLFVTHNRAHAQQVGGKSILMAGGRVLEMQRTDLFFKHPKSQEAQCYVRTGSCQVPSPTAKAEDLASHVPPPPPLPVAAQVAVRSSYEGPRGFFWLQAGRLGGCPRPGIVQETEDDLRSLKRMGISILVTLEERQTVAKDALDAAQIKSMFFPIDDMQAPSIANALDLCSQIKRLADQGEVLAFHCRAGLGRTGTLLTAMLIFDGIPAVAAIDQAREINPKWIQSQEQVNFLSNFENALRPNVGSPNA